VSNNLCQRDIQYRTLYDISFLVKQMRLGNSSYSPTIAGLVLEHLCPAIQNILEDGLRDHKLDFIIGQRRNHSWSVVEVSTRAGTCNYSITVSFLSSTKSCYHRMMVKQFCSWSLFWFLSNSAGPSTRVLYSLVSKIRQCPQLTSHCMRLRAFIMGLLK